MNKLLVLIVLGLILSLLSGPSLVNAEIKLIPPKRWQPDADNNQDIKWWYQNSTKSSFGINKAPANGSFPLSLPLALIGPSMAQGLADRGILESTDQITFGHSNYGYRYFLNISDPSKQVNTSDFAQPGSVVDLIRKGYDVPFRGMLILSQKQGDLYAVVLLSPKENFDSVMKEIQPTIDSMELSNSTAN